jgi:hypothetical protein
MKQNETKSSTKAQNRNLTQYTGLTDEKPAHPKTTKPRTKSKPNDRKKTPNQKEKDTHNPNASK